MVASDATIPARSVAAVSARRASSVSCTMCTGAQPKNAENVALFIEKDVASHAELEKLFAAAKWKDTKATSLQLGVVLSRCSDCHDPFRR
jgi:cytochrome c556